MLLILLFDKIKVRTAFSLSSMLLSFSFAGFWLYISLRGYAIILPGNKKSTSDRASFLPAELVNITPFSGLFFVDFFRNFQEKLRRPNVVVFLKKVSIFKALTLKI